MLRDRLTINIIANAGASPLGTSGGDRIFIECARGWVREGHKMRILVWKEGYEVCKKNKLEDVDYKVFKSEYKPFGFPFMYLARTIEGCVQALRIRPKENSEKTVIYSSSDFWPDSLPAFIMKKRVKNSKWVAGFYFFAPSPFKSSSDIEYRGGRAPFRLKNLAYHFSQRIVYRLIGRNADFILVANELDKSIFVKDGVSPAKVIPVYGGVDIKAISQIPPPQVSKYDGCFVGRLHPQKGPLELVRIWGLVCKARPSAKLALIGNGPSENEVKDEIRRRNLDHNIDMLGYVGSNEMYDVLKSSKVFLHTPVLDTGGMAAAEGMACGLPVVGFDLPGYHFCYPRGMLKAPIGDIEAFAALVLNLLQDEDLYYKARNEALEFAQQWDWDRKVRDILNSIESLFAEV